MIKFLSFEFVEGRLHWVFSSSSISKMIFRH